MKDRKALIEGLRQRTQETYDAREDRRREVIDRSKVSGYPFFDPGMGEHLIDFLPYMAGSKDPSKPKGSPTYLVDLYVHRRIGPNEDNFICLYKTYGKSCPICDHRNKLKHQEEPTTEEGRERLKTEMEFCRPKRYSVYAIWDRDNEAKGVQIWIIAHWFIQRRLMAACRIPRGGGVIPFMAPDKEEGRSVSFTIEGSKMATQYDGFQFFPRQEDIPDEILDNVPVLDECLDIPTYAEVKRAFWAGLENGNEEEEVVVKAASVMEEEGCPVGLEFGKDFDLYEECTPCVKRDACADALGGVEEEELEFPPQYEEEEVPEPVVERPRPKAVQQPAQSAAAPVPRRRRTA